MRRRRIAKRKTPEPTTEEEIRKNQNLLMGDLAEEGNMLLTQMDRFCLAVLADSGSEFLGGVGEAEVDFRISWEEVTRMGRGWQGYSGDRRVAKVWLDQAKGVLCSRFPYDAGMIQEMKEKLPRGKKNWNPDDKIWEFSVEVIEELIPMLGRHFDEVIDLTQALPTPQVGGGGDLLLSILDTDDRKKILILLTKKYHPDTGGDGKKMAEINSIFNKYKNGGGV